jgi:high-affinity Fe2+/Pb2+ permease
MSSFKQDNKKWGRQWVGAFAGAAVGWALTYLFPSIGQRYSMTTVLLVGAALGAALASLDRFIRAGAALTRRDNRALNLLVGLGIPILLLLLLLLLSR